MVPRRSDRPRVVRGRARAGGRRPHHPRRGAPRGRRGASRAHGASREHQPGLVRLRADHRRPTVPPPRPRIIRARGGRPVRRGGRGRTEGSHLHRMGRRPGAPRGGPPGTGVRRRLRRPRRLTRPEGCAACGRLALTWKQREERR
ncbi:hypothetical protein E0W78_05005 [Aeromicrobium sp. IC_218]|nr:hypothetical protein E0W78_05005 [Aeromicrobium sp. IC_218]